MGYRSFHKIMLILVSLTLFTAWIDPFSDNVSKGNKEYNDGKFSEAMNSYKEAEKYAPDDSKKNMLDFNKGNADFRMNNLESAIGRYRNSMNSGDPEVQKKAFYNTGTSYMKMGKKREAAESFIKALQVDPSYEKAKKNLEYLLKDKPQDKQQNSGDNQSGDKKDRKNAGSGKGSGRDDKGNDKKSGSQVRNMLESMKNKPVRRQKGNGDGKRYLEKYW